MCDFKKGDMVKCINNKFTIQTLTVDKIYRIISKTNVSIKIINDHGMTHYYGYSRFELVEREIDFLKLLDEFS